MVEIDPELLTLLIAERLARERLSRLAMVFQTDDVVKAAESLLQEASDAVAAYRAKHP